MTGKTLALPNLIALQHIPLSPGSVEREQQVYREFLALYDVKKDLEAKSVGVRQKKKEVSSALDRTARLIITSPSKARSEAETEKAIDELDDRRVYDPRDRAQDKAFKR
ncbi:hypothetical protein EML4058_26025 (plasmid) [Agrobacterium fabrum]|nr:hypothetical protein EML4058_26025 [Agrobacterium fabrum]